jgi:hypothetical protein
MQSIKRFIYHLLGSIGVWLCDTFQPRPLTDCERVGLQQYCQLMIASLKGEIPHYGRDRDKDHVPVVAERSWWAARNDNSDTPAIQ